MDDTNKQSLASLHQYRRFKIDLSAFYQNKKVRTYTSLILTVGTTAFFLFFAIRPTAMTIAKLAREIKDNKKVVQGLDQKIESLNSAQIEYQRVKGELPLIDEALPLHPNLAALVRQIEALARKDGVELSTLQFSSSILTQAGQGGETGRAREAATANTGQQAELDFSLTTTGDYDHLRLFARDLTGLRRIIEIDTFGLGQQNSEKLTLTLKATAIYLE